MDSAFSRFGGLLGILAGLCGLLYLASFVITRSPAGPIPALLLLVSGVAASGLLVGMYLVLKPTDEGFALWGLLVGFAGAIGMATHGAFDLSNVLHPPAATIDFPAPMDPRGFAAFALAGLAALVLSWVMLQAQNFPRIIAQLGIVSGVLLLGLYISFVLTLDPSHPIVLGLVLSSGLLQPLWYLGAGWTLWHGVGKH